MKIAPKDDRLDKKKKFHFDNVFTSNPQLYESISLCQIGDLSCEKGYVIGEHVQECYEISYIVSGKGLYLTKGTYYPVQEGDIMLNVPGDIHDVKVDEYDPFRIFYLGFHFENGLDDQHSFTHIRKMFDHNKNAIVLDSLGIDVPFISAFSELLNLKNYSNLMLKTYLHQIIVIAYRNYYDNWVNEYMPQTKVDESKQIVYEVINYIDTHLHHITELTQIADELNYSYSYLSHIFSREVGYTIRDYYNRKRFEMAIEWLKKGELNVTQIAEKLQYKSIHTFSKAFRNNFDVSPTEYHTLSLNNKK